MSRGYIEVGHGPMRLTVDLPQPLTVSQMLALIPVVEAMEAAVDAYTAAQGGDERMSDGDTRIEGGAKVCRFCNKVLTFFMDRPAEPCSCAGAAAARLQPEETP